MLDKDYNFKGHVEIFYMAFFLCKLLSTNKIRFYCYRNIIYKKDSM